MTQFTIPFARGTIVEGAPCELVQGSVSVVDGKLPSPRTSSSFVSSSFADLEPLSSGGRAAGVFRAIHRATGTRVVVKTYLKRDLVRAGADASHRVAFEREALARTAQPGLLAATQDSASVALVMKCAPGKPLSSILQTQPDMFPDIHAVSVPAILRAVVDVLQKIHDANVLHLDLTLENILVSINPDGALLVTPVDFGSAALVDVPEYDRDYASTTCLDVLPPELIEASCRPSCAADIWALGVCAFRLLCAGQSPFRGGGDYAMLNRIAARKPFESLPFPGAVSDVAKDFVHKCLHPNPAFRLGVLSSRDPTEVCETGSNAIHDLKIDYDLIRKHPFLSVPSSPMRT